MAGAHCYRGKMSLTSVPRPTALAISIRPPWRSKQRVHYTAFE
jgi:hypothetical protein